MKIISFCYNETSKFYCDYSMVLLWLLHQNRDEINEVFIPDAFRARM